MDILDLLASSNYIALNRDLIKAIGLEEAIILGELASEYSFWKAQDGLDEEGCFYSTTENIEERTSLSEYKQRIAIKKLCEIGVLEVKVKGVPAKRFFKFNLEACSEIFKNKFLKNSGTSTQKNSVTSSEKIKELEPEKLKGNKNNINKINNKNNNKNKINNNISLSSNLGSSDKDIYSSSQKFKYGEYKNVLLTNSEFEKLKNEYTNYEDLIKFLDEYIEMKGYKAKSHYLCIKKWVVDAVKERKRKQESTSNPFLQFLKE